jgi:hypothetical protein
MMNAGFFEGQQAIFAAAITFLLLMWLVYLFQTVQYSTNRFYMFRGTVLLPTAGGLLFTSICIYATYPVGFAIFIANLGYTSSTLLTVILAANLAGKLTKRKTIGLLIVTVGYLVCFEVVRQSGFVLGRLTLFASMMAFLFLWPFIIARETLKDNRESIRLDYLSLVLGLGAGFWILRVLCGIAMLVYPTPQEYFDAAWGNAIRIWAVGFNLFLLLLISNRFFEMSLLKERIQKNNMESAMLTSLISLSLVRDNETGQHIIRTQNYVKIIAKRLQQLSFYKDQLSDRQIEVFYKVAPLHDLGKVGIPDSILKKPGKLSDEEWGIMKTHAAIGENILSSVESDTKSKFEVVTIAAEISGGHHEKWDGSGYPRALIGEQIPLSARIMALADVYDALTSARVYKPAWPHEQACMYIIAKSGSAFDPFVVTAFVAETETFRAIAKKFRDPI